MKEANALGCFIFSNLEINLFQLGKIGGNYVSFKFRLNYIGPWKKREPKISALDSREVSKPQYQLVK